MEVFFEILKYTLPSAIVFLTVYLLLKQYFEQERIKLMTAQHKERYQSSLPLKLQAYERLALFLERIRIPYLMMRFPMSDGSSSDLCKTLLLGIQQEYEHNMVQQIYVSEKLWEIIVLAKDEVLHEVDAASQQASISDLQQTKHYLVTVSHQNTSRVIDTALTAIKREIQLLL
ncbi:MAG: hypothetical protein IPO78_04130 [Saprospiraceae bacterium]|nr:hypothetical protein [Saprospiraceae bacterium]MBK9223261.1 hypothetical protein [Saprospiraceae bacterium]MBK9720791.1 hypothetical protein [Saprospiraceae bacterium]